MSEVQSDQTEIQSDNQNKDQNNLTLEQLLEENKKLQNSLKATAEESKKFRQTNSALKTQMEAIEQEKLKEQGKWKELHDAAEAKAQKLQEDLKAKDAKVLTKNIEAEFVREASALGCLDTRALIKLVDLKKVATDDELNVDPKSVKALVDEAQKSMAYLFKKGAPNVNDLPGKKDTPPAGEYETEMRACKTQKEIETVMRRHGKL